MGIVHLLDSEQSVPFAVADNCRIDLSYPIDGQDGSLLERRRVEAACEVSIVVADMIEGSVKA